MTDDAYPFPTYVDGIALWACNFKEDPDCTPCTCPDCPVNQPMSDIPATTVDQGGELYPEEVTP